MIISMLSELIRGFIRVRLTTFVKHDLVFRDSVDMATACFYN